MAITPAEQLAAAIADQTRIRDSIAAESERIAAERATEAAKAAAEAALTVPGQRSA